MTAEAGADMLGFNFHAKSPRYIEAEACQRITAVLRREHPLVQLVGVFVNIPPDTILQVLGACALDAAQLSGDESVMARAALGERSFKAFHGVPSGAVDAYARRSAPSLLVDGQAIGAYGGTGAVADWRAAADLAARYPLLLAGGLTPENVAAAIGQVRPWGVDVASGVEARPGEKDAGKVRAFIQAVRSTEVQVR